MSGIENAFFNPDKDGKILIGNHLVELKDESRRTFETDNMEAFESFLADKQEKAEIYYGSTDLHLVPQELAKNSRPLAHCTLADSASLRLVLASVGFELGILDFEKFLTAMRPYTKGSTLQVLSHLRNFSVAKKQTYQRVVDNVGNYKLNIQRESAGSEDWVPPATVTFEVPVFRFLKETIVIECDLHFAIKDEGTKPIFLLDNLNLKDQVEDRRREIVEDRLGKASTCPKYWGKSILHALDNGWQYRENKAVL